MVRHRSNRFRRAKRYRSDFTGARMARIANPDALGEFALLGLLALVWGSSYLFVKIALATIPPITLIAARVSIAAVFLLTIAGYRGERLPGDWTTWRLLFSQAVFNSIASWTLLAWGQQHVDSGVAGVLNSTSPIFVLLFAWMVRRDRSVTAVHAGGALLGLIGVVLIVGIDVLRGLGAHIAGQLAALGSAVLYACAAIHGRRFGRLAPTVSAAGTMLCATACLVPLSLLTEHPWSLELSATSIAATLALGFVCTGVALLIYFRLVKTIGSVGVASQSYLRAGVSVVLGMVALDERIAPTTAMGLLAVILGVVLINTKKSPAGGEPAGH
jgi:drug/metabolite transporter (DMT)-like permease